MAMLAYAIMLIGGIWVIVIAFQKSLLWGLGSLIIPFVALIFVAMNFNETKKPFFIWLGGFILYLITFMIR